MANQGCGCRRDQYLRQESSIIQADLFQDEGDRRQWRIEAPCQSRRRTTQKRRPPVLSGHTKPTRDIRCQSPGEMNRRTFSSQAASASDCEYAAKELRYHYLSGNKSEVPPVSHHHLRNAAPGCSAADK